MLQYSSTPWVLILMFLWLTDLILKTAFQIWKRNFFNWNFTKKSPPGFEPRTSGSELQHSTSELSWSLLKYNVLWRNIKIVTAANVPKYGFNDLKKYMFPTQMIQIYLYKYFWFQNENITLCNLVLREPVKKKSQE